MTAIYRQLLLRSGLSEQAAATLHQVSVEQVREWTRHRVRVPMSAVAALHQHYRSGCESVDIPDSNLDRSMISEVPEGYEIARVDMVMQLRKKR